MQNTLEQKIGFDRLRDMVEEQCSNRLSKRMCDEMTFTDDYSDLMHLLRQTSEMRRIVMFATSFPSQDFFDLSEALAPLRIDNTAIQQQDLFAMRCSLHTLFACLDFLLPAEGEEVEYPELALLANQVVIDRQLIRNICKIVDERGEIYDDASPELFDVRQQMQRKRANVDIYLNRALSRAKQEGWAPENAEPTIRNGRMVIPMLDTHRRKMKGLIHDESATRQTAYLEPAEVVELNNDLRELEFAEHREILRILMRFSDSLRPQLPQLMDAYWFLARIDFIRAKARVALTLNADMPIVVENPKIEWFDARHPLLYLQRLADGGRQQSVVPFDMRLDTAQRILIISGPNAGGKSVCLKAVGLIQYMLQCGMLVPCRATSEFGLFHHLSIDIGDQQSIDDDLSTYTSHLRNMRQLLKEADASTLFLLDELGGGTEPRSGCAIAEAILDELDSRGSFGVVTTHFADLKLLADSHPAIVNAAMLFDTDLMRPLYRLSIGQPGSSFAFEIAASVGIPQAILDKATQKVGHTMLNFEHQLQQLELDKQRVAEQQARLEASDAFLAEVISKYQALSDDLQLRRHDIISEARQEARHILSEANRSVEQTISEIKNAQAEKERTAEARRRMAALDQQISEKQQKDEASMSEVRQRSATRPRRKGEKVLPVRNDEPAVPIAVGTIVRIDGQDTFGEVVSIKGNKAVVESNSLRLTIALDRLTGTARQHLPVDNSAQCNSRYQSIFNDINEKRKHFNPTLDLRGQRVEEAMTALQRFFDDALLLGEKQLRILHGKGYGILKQAIREWLQSNRDVASFASERIELGGDGITVVNLK